MRVGPKCARNDPMTGTQSRPWTSKTRTRAMPADSKRRPTGSSALRRRLSIIECLVAGLPFVLFLYAEYSEGPGLEPRQVLFVGATLLVVLAGLVMVRRFFERVTDFARTVQEAAHGAAQSNAAALETFRSTRELKGIADAFGTVLNRMETANRELERKVAGLSVLKEMLRLSGETGDMDLLLGSLLKEAMNLSGASIGSVFAVESHPGHPGPRLRLVRHQGADSDAPPDFPATGDAPIMHKVILGRRALRVQNIEWDPRTQKPNDPRYGAPSFMSLPVFAGDDTVAVVNLARKEGRAAFDEEDEQLLTLAVAEMGFALQNVRLRSKAEGHDAVVGRLSEELARERELCRNVETEKNLLASRMIHAQEIQALGTLAGGVAHDFNNLLMAIQGNVSLLLIEAKPETAVHTRLKNIERQVESGSRLTSRLLSLSRKGRGEVGPVDLNKVVADTAEVFGRARKDVVIRLDLLPSLARVKADPTQLEQVLWNLYLNAGDAMPSGGRISVRTENAAARDTPPDCALPPGRYVRVRVSDNGAGIPPEILPRVFDSFFTTKEPGKGTGLGLASVREIVKTLGGVIFAESGPGPGASFEIIIPAIEE